MTRQVQACSCTLTCCNTSNLPPCRYLAVPSILGVSWVTDLRCVDEGLTELALGFHRGLYGSPMPQQEGDGGSKAQPHKGCQPASSQSASEQATDPAKAKSAAKPCTSVNTMTSLVRVESGLMTATKNIEHGVASQSSQQTSKEEVSPLPPARGAGR